MERGQQILIDRVAGGDNHNRIHSSGLTGVEERGCGRIWRSKSVCVQYGGLQEGNESLDGRE
jgi:hypothetical protein